MNEIADEMKEKEEKESEKPKKQKKEMVKNERSGKGKFGEKTEAFTSAIQRAQHWMKSYPTPDSIPDSVVP
jgi:hypothetical protein